LEALRRQNIESLIVRELILTDALEAGYEVPKQHLDEHIASLIATNYYGDSNLLLKVLAQQGRTVEQLREDIRGHDLIVATRHKKTSDIPAPTNEQIEAYYTKHQTNYWQPEAVRVSMLVLPLSPTNPPVTPDSQRRLAQEIRNRLVSGLDLADVAKLYRERARAHSAKPEWFERGTLRKELDQAVFAVKPGDLSEVIETGDYLYMLQVRDRRPARLQPLAEVKNEIKSHLENQAKEASERDWIAELRSKAVIRRFP
jgi:parvulin-like peptidyl-prolyl isomerase